MLAHPLFGFEFNPQDRLALPCGSIESAMLTIEEKNAIADKVLALDHDIDYAGESSYTRLPKWILQGKMQLDFAGQIATGFGRAICKTGFCRGFCKAN